MGTEIGVAIGLAAQHTGQGTPDVSALAHRGAEARVPEQNLTDAIVREARWSLSNNSKEVTIKLHPEHLGEVRMKVRHQDGALKLDMTVENHAVKSLIESRMEDLRARLQSEQFTSNNEFMFNVDVHQGNNSHDPSAELADDGHGGTLRANGSDDGGADNAPRDFRARPRWGQAGVGIYA